ncbi:hypothetical protein [Streptomyces sp. NBC_01601]|uniref:hypothetical protein n=1 Tax=Streptomyces sp. NBC_01601 TaxID=2975892 RepID=UPI002E27FF75|nr:hypothetical protein [Streptomyces sp. NBC_01601]
MEQLPASSKPVVVIRDEMQDLAAAVDRELQAVKAEVSPRELTTRELLTELARQGRRPDVYVPGRLPFVPHRMSDFD